MWCKRLGYCPFANTDYVANPGIASIINLRKCRSPQASRRKISSVENRDICSHLLHEDRKVGPLAIRQRCNGHMGAWESVDGVARLPNDELIELAVV